MRFLLHHQGHDGIPSRIGLVLVDQPLPVIDLPMVAQSLARMTSLGSVEYASGLPVRNALFRSRAVHSMATSPPGYFAGALKQSREA